MGGGCFGNRNRRYQNEVDKLSNGITNEILQEMVRVMNNTYETSSKLYSMPTNKNDKGLFEHPTIKPMKLIKRFIHNSSKENDIVLDCFAGSGTTCVASKELNRRFVGFEINPKWCKIANDRIDGITASGQMSLILR